MPRTLNNIDIWSSDDIVATCPKCHVTAIVALTPRLVALQPDDTTHVCHPGFGGCNHGFALDPPASPSP